MTKSILLNILLGLVIFSTRTEIYGQSADCLSQKSELAFEVLCSGDQSDFSELKEALFDPRLNTQVRTVLEAVGTAEAITMLEEGLQSDEPICVAGCLDSLGKLGVQGIEKQVISLTQNIATSKIVRCSAYKYLGRIASRDACDTLKDGLGDPDIEIRRSCADGLFDAGSRLNDASLFRAVRIASIDKPTTKIAVQNEILISGATKPLIELFSSDCPSDFKAACYVISDDKKWNVTFWNSMKELIRNSPAELGNRIIVALGGAGNNDVVPLLLSVLEDKKSKFSKVEVIKSLGEYDDPAVFEACFEYLSSTDEQTRKAAIDSICKLSVLTEDNVVLLKKILNEYLKDQESKMLLLSCLSIIERKEIISLLEPVMKIALESNDKESIVASIKVWASVIQPTKDSVEWFVRNFGDNDSLERDDYITLLEILCHRVSEKDLVITELEKQFNKDPALLARLVGVMGGRYAADYLGWLALSKVDEYSDTAIATIDEVTNALGRWATPDAAESLARLAILLPEGRLSKFKTRAIRGYIRIVRQMGETPLQKVQRISNALRMTENRPQERALLENLDSRFTSKFCLKSLFNGKDLKGWEEYEPGIFVVNDGAIVGGNNETGVVHNHFLTTSNDYRNFYLHIECKIVASDQNQLNDGNAGIQFRSVRIPDNWEMVGYQADMTSDGSYWGCLYDESRRNRMLQVPNADLQKAVVRLKDWNIYEILAQEGNIKVFVNGIQTVDYTEDDTQIPLEGKIGLQIHAGGPALAYYRNIFICDVDSNESN